MHRGGKKLKEWLKFLWLWDDPCNNAYGDYTEYKNFWKTIIVLDLAITNAILLNPTRLNTKVKMSSFITSLSVFSLHLLLLLMGLFLSPVISDPRGETVAQMCNNRTMTPQQKSLVVTNFLAAMDAVSPLLEAKGYGQVVNGTGNLTVYAYGECMKDLDKKDCDLCFAQIKAKVPRCLPFQQITRGGRVFSDGCYVRYHYHLSLKIWNFE